MRRVVKRGGVKVRVSPKRVAVAIICLGGSVLDGLIVLILVDSVVDTFFSGGCGPSKIYGKRE